MHRFTADFVEVELIVVFYVPVKNRKPLHNWGVSGWLGRIYTYLSMKTAVKAHHKEQWYRVTDPVTRVRGEAIHISLWLAADYTRVPHLTRSAQLLSDYVHMMFIAESHWMRREEVESHLGPVYHRWEPLRTPTTNTHVILELPGRHYLACRDMTITKQG